MPEKMEFTDQMGYKVSVPWPPKRIISVVPSQSELLASLGLEEEVVGITKFCIHPESWFRTKERIGGTKNIDLAKVEHLKPDLIIANKEENKEEQIKELMPRYPVWISDIHNLDDALGMIASVGKLVNKSGEANTLIDLIQRNFKQLFALTYPSKKVAYFIWRDPYMSVNRHTFINHMLENCKLTNVFKDRQNDYPAITEEELKQANPEIILLSSEPYPFADKHVTEFKEICPTAKVMLVDGEFFSWYGSRLVNAPAYLLQCLKQIHND